MHADRTVWRNGFARRMKSQRDGEGAKNHIGGMRRPEAVSAASAQSAMKVSLKPLVVVMAGADEFDPYKD